jgi:hypothetical protein
MDKPVKPDPKKVYEPPRLIVYGTVRDLTQKVGTRKTGDGGSRPNVRTAM